MPEIQDKDVFKTFDAGSIEKLGKYTCPMPDKAGQPQFKGSGKYGLQPDFADACFRYLEAVNAVSAKGGGGYVGPNTVGHIKKAEDGTVQDYWSLPAGTSGGLTYGFIERSTAERYREQGFLTFLSSEPVLATFGFGLALWLDGDPRKMAVAAPSPESYGLMVQTLTSGECYLRPASNRIDWDKGATGVSYDGPADSTPSVEDGVDGVELDDNAAQGEGSQAGSGSAATAGNAATSSPQTISLGEGAYFFANQFKSIENAAASFQLTGNRALANDEPISNPIINLCHASMRSYMCGPDGSFIAFFPDFWGMYGNKTPTIVLSDIELMDFNVTHSDNTFYSHVYSPGVSRDGSAVSERYTSGVVSIESSIDANVAEASAIDGDYRVSDSVSPILDKLLNIPEGYEWMYTPKELYRRYGARPLKSKGSLGSSVGAVKAVENMAGDSIDVDTGIEKENPSSVIPYLLALYEFMYQWAEQHKCDLQITFMPELFPGYRIKIPSLDVTVFVKSVSHSMSYTGGFTTNATCICPTGTLVPGMVLDGERMDKKMAERMA